MINIIADENLAYPVELFSQFGNVHLVNGRKITNSILTNADALMIRSVTEVTESLIDGTKIKFVGTATIGTDHIDIDYLKSKGIAFANAPGCNSYAVAEYVTASLIYTAVKNKFSLKDKTIGVVGIGNVGSKVARFCEALGMNVLKNDPPLCKQGKLSDSMPLNRLLGADIISLHVPLTFEGEDKTYHLFDEEKLGLLKSNTLLINTSRGAVIDNEALIRITNKKKLNVVLDVWENEPDILNDLVNNVLIGTPHIAGYTLEGKVNGSIMILKALADFLGKESYVNINLPEVIDNLHDYDFSGNSEAELYKIINRIYNIGDDHSKLISINSLPGKDRGRYFDKLRKEYPLRREFNNYKVKLNMPKPAIEKMLRDLRFTVYAR